MVCIVQVPVLGWMPHACRVSAHDVEVCTCIDAGLGVPLHLCGASVEHGAGEDGNHGSDGVKHALLQNLQA